MAVTLVSLSGFQRGVEADETSINIESFEVASEPEFRDEVAGKTGEVRGFAVAQTKSNITVTGEKSASSSGIVGVTSATAYVLANDIDQFGQSTGGCYPIRYTESQSRDGFRSITVEFVRLAGVA